MRRARTCKAFPRTRVFHPWEVSDAEATEALQEWAQIEISVNSVWRLTQTWGEALKQVEEQEAEHANPSVEALNTPPAEMRLRAAMDGCCPGGPRS
jgi:hypothetical protein